MSRSDPLGQLFGRLAVEGNFIRDHQLREALAVQESLAREGHPLAIGSILRDLGHLRMVQVEEILQLQKGGARSDLERREAAFFGELAIQNEFAARKQIEEALRIQGQGDTTLKIGTILVRRNVMTESQRQSVLRAIQRIVIDRRDLLQEDEPTPSEEEIVPPSPGGEAPPFCGLFHPDENAG